MAHALVANLANLASIYRTVMATARTKAYVNHAQIVRLVTTSVAALLTEFQHALFANRAIQASI